MQYSFGAYRFDPARYAPHPCRDAGAAAAPGV